MKYEYGGTVDVTLTVGQSLNLNGNALLEAAERITVEADSGVFRVDMGGIATATNGFIVRPERGFSSDSGRKIRDLTVYCVADGTLQIVVEKGR